MTKNAGKYLESLVSWINECLHDKAEITPNEYFIDKDTGKKRQIDISIKLKDGPIEFLAIVEVRDRSRPVGVEYIEQVKSKKESVNADMAIIVSKEGYYKTAIQKAEKYGIRLFTAEEALKDNWSKSISNLKSIIVRSIQGNATMYILEKSRQRIIDPSDEFQEISKKSSKSDLIFVDKDGKPFKSKSDLFSVATQARSLWNRLKVGEENKKNLKIYCPFNMEEKAYFPNKSNKLIPIEFVCFHGDFWIEEKLVSPQVFQYKDGDKTLAEIMKLDMSNNQFVEMLIKDPDEIDKDRTISVRIKKST